MLNTKCRIGLFGGTFDPVHYGHLLIAEAARESARLDRVIFIPAGHAPLKAKPRTPAHDRLAMLRLAIHGHPDFSVNDWEIRQKRVVYTIETVSHFRRHWPKAELYFILGSDARKSLPHWHQARHLSSLCRLLSVKRFDPFSSRELRRRLRRGASIRYWVPASVEGYIQKHRLYSR
jgi:nicotinate-nucleotide adenylyltransferase